MTGATPAVTASTRPGTRRRAWVGIAAVVLALAVLTTLVALRWGPLIGVDTQVTRSLVPAVAAHPAAVAATTAVTDLGGPLAVDLFTALAALVLLWRRRWRAIGYLILVRLLALAAETGLKNAIARPRPDMVHPLVTAGGYSFPSGHTTGTTALCLSVLVVAAAALGRGGRAALAAAAVVFSVAVAASRVLLGVHYLSDVLGGLLTGALAAALGWVLLRGADRPG